MTSNSSAPPQDPRIEAEPLTSDKKHYSKMLGVDSGLSEDTSSGLAFLLASRILFLALCVDIVPSRRTKLQICNRVTDLTLN